MTMHDQSTGRCRRPLRRTGGLLLAATIVLSAVFVVPIAPGPLGTPVARAADPGIQPRVPVVPGVAALSRQVYGYLPYWRLDPGTADRLDYGLVSTIAFFGITIMADGNIDTAWRGYTAYLSGDALAVTNAAHARGVRVVPTFQLFDSGSLPQMSAFLGSVDAQTLFIGQALDLMAARSADGANIDFEPVPATIAPAFVAFVQRFGAAMRARFPDATLVVATSATAPSELIDGLAPVVDQMLVMTYNYRWTGSTATGAIAPLDNAPKTVKLTLARYLDRVPASKLIMGVPYYGYDWPVTSDQPNAVVQPDSTAYGGVWSVTYASAMDWLALHPETPRQEDTIEGSAFFTYRDTDLGTFRQVYFEDELSAAAKYDYVIATGLAGIGIWTLDGDRGYAGLWNVLRAKFYAAVHATTVGGKVGTVSNRAGTVRIYHAESVRNIGNVPETGVLSWRIVDRAGRVIRKGSLQVTLYPGTIRTIHATTVLGTASGLRAGTYRLLIRFAASTGSWTAPDVLFRQRY
jgi:hypothetical protein